MKSSYKYLEDSLTGSQNRAYYAVFYIVTALAYLDGFIPLIKSHHKLMGYFNKNYVYQNKTFNSSLTKIYKELILNREKSDYDFLFKITKEQVLISIEEAKKFIEVVKPYILKRLSEENQQ